MNTLNEGPCATAHVWRPMHLGRNQYLCDICGYTGFVRDGLIVQSTRHIQAAWYGSSTIWEESDFPSVATVGEADKPPTGVVQDYRPNLVEYGMNLYRFHEKGL